jgi:hypothetical protein
LSLVYTVQQVSDMLQLVLNSRDKCLAQPMALPLATVSARL